MSAGPVLELVVLGKSEPQGSAQAWVPTNKQGEPYRRNPTRQNPRGSIVVNVTSDNKALKGWREAITAAARASWGSRRPVADVGFALELIAYLKRRDADWGTGRNAAQLKDQADAYPIKLPDADKLLRAINDSLTGVVWKDDSQVTDEIVRKRYAVPGEHNDGVRATIRVWINDVQKAVDLPLEQRIRHIPGVDAGAAGGDLTLL